MIGSKDPLPGPSPQDQLTDKATGVRPTGQVHAVRLRRRSRKHPEMLLFKGEPASKHGIAKSVMVNIAPHGEELPAPVIDREKGRIHLYYPSAEHPEVLALTEDPAGHVCYLWTSGDGKQSRAWLVKTP